MDFLKTGDGAKCNGTAAEGHCFAIAGTPRPDADGDWSWWATLFIGVFSVLHRLDPSLRYAHVWNEVNSHFFNDKFPNGSRVTGAWYAEFYRPVAEALVAAFPPELSKAGLPKANTGIALGGPVSFSPPFQEAAGRIVDKTWVQWFEPLLHATAVPANSSKLLGWVEFHAYNGADVHGECTNPNCHNAAAATIEMNLQQIALEGQAMGQPGLLTSITETNFSLESEADETDWTKRFQQCRLDRADDDAPALARSGHHKAALYLGHSARTPRLLSVPAETDHRSGYARDGDLRGFRQFQRWDPAAGVGLERQGQCERGAGGRRLRWHLG